MDRKIKLLTADDYALFIDRKLAGGGKIIELVTAALNSNSKVQDFGIYVVNDWAVHLDPLLTDAVLHLGFPWFKPDCASVPDSFRCAKLNFSEPMFEVLMLFYQWKDRPFAFNSDVDMAGKTLCHPKGYLTHDLEGNGRNFAKQRLG